jgi:hypothetical protein
MAVWRKIKVCQAAITVYSRLPHPTKLLSRIVCRGQGGFQGKKGTLKPDIGQQFTYDIFLKPMSPQKIRRRI